MGHGNTSCDPHLHQSHQATNAPLPHAKRLPHGRLRSNAGNRPVEFGTWELYPALTINCQAGDLLHHLLRKREDASRAIGSPWPNPAASNERPASFLWLARPSSKLSKPTGSPRPMTFMHTSPAKSIRPECHSSATCPAQCPGT